MESCTFSSFEETLETGLSILTVVFHPHGPSMEGFVTLAQQALLMPLFFYDPGTFYMLAASYLFMGIISHYQATKRTSLHF